MDSMELEREKGIVVFCIVWIDCVFLYCLNTLCVFRDYDPVSCDVLQVERYRYQHYRYTRSR